MISVERTNLARLDPRIIGEPVNLITMDLSYLAVADAIGQIDRQLLAPVAQLIALIKPTFELHAAALAGRPEQVTAAVDAAERALRHHGGRSWDSGHRPSSEQRSGRNAHARPHTGCQHRGQLLPSAPG